MFDKSMVSDEFRFFFFFLISWALLCTLKTSLQLLPSRWFCNEIFIYFQHGNGNRGIPNESLLFLTGAV